MATESYEQTAAKGLFWTSWANIGGKGLSLFSQIVLGWTLSKEDFGQYAIAIGLAAVFMAFRYGGASDVLVQKSYDYQRHTAAVRRIAIAFNLLIALVIAASAHIVAEFYALPVLEHLLYIFAACQLINIPVATTRPAALVHSKFREVARVDFRSMVARHLGMIAFALAGFGVYSFVLPLLLISLYESVAFVLLARSCAPTKTPQAPQESVASVLVQSRWVLLAGASIAVMNYGTSLVISYFEVLAAVAVFYFGFQIFANVFSLVDSNLRAVLLTLLSHMNDDPDRQSAAFFRATRMIALTLSAGGAAAALICPPATHWIFAGKWDGAIAVIQIFMFTLPFMGVSSAAYSLLAAQARWKSRSLFLLFEATLLIVMIGVGSHIGTVVTATAFIFAVRAVYAVVLTAIVAHESARLIQVRVISKYIVVPAIPGAILAYLSSMYGSFDALPLHAAALALYMMVLGVLCLTVFRSESGEIRRLTSHMFSG